MQTFFIMDPGLGIGSLRGCYRASAVMLSWVLLSAASCGFPAREGRRAQEEPAPGIGWSSAAPLPVALGGHASGIVGSELVVAGGTYWDQDRKVYADSVSAYDPASDRWTAWPSLPHPVGYAAGASIGDRLYVGGGSDGASDRANVYVLQSGAGEPLGAWVELAPLPEPRVYAAGVVIVGRLFVTGGASRGGDLASVSSELIALPLGGTSKWENRAPLPGPGRALHAAISCAGAIYVFGGCRSDPGGAVQDLQDAYRYWPEDDQWERIRDLPWPVRGQSAVCYQDRFVLLAGGYTGYEFPEQEGFRSDVIAYDTAFGDYTPLSRLPQGVMDSEAHIHGDKLFIVGGEDRARGRSKQFAVGALPDIAAWLETKGGTR